MWGKAICSITYEYTYNYDVKFFIKDGKFKIILENVYCKNARMVGSTYSIVLIQPFDGDNCPETGTIAAIGCPKKSVIPMMYAFKEDLQKNIIDAYINKMKIVNKVNDSDGW